MKDFSKFWDLLSNKNKSYFLLLVFLTFILALLEVMSIAIVIPFVTLLLDPESFNSYKYSYFLNPLLGLGSSKDLILSIRSLLEAK